MRSAGPSEALPSHAPKRPRGPACSTQNGSKKGRGFGEKTARKSPHHRDSLACEVRWCGCDGWDYPMICTQL